MAALDRCYNIADLRAAAQRRLPRGVFEFVDRGSEDEVALRNNRAGFERIKLKHRALVDVSGRVNGHDAVRQAGRHADGDRAHGRGRAVLARGRAGAGEGGGEGKNPVHPGDERDDLDGEDRRAGGARVPAGGCGFSFMSGTGANCRYQLIERAKAAGFEALIVTVDTIVPPNREYNARNGFPAAVPRRRRASPSTSCGTRPGRPACC